MNTLVTSNEGRSLYTKSINKALSSSLLVDVGQVWAEAR